MITKDNLHLCIAFAVGAAAGWFLSEAFLRHFLHDLLY
jgi:hypothetical protein